MWRGKSHAINAHDPHCVDPFDSRPLCRHDGVAMARGARAVDSCRSSRVVQGVGVGREEALGHGFSILKSKIMKTVFVLEGK